jgi:hypothetical protein
MSGELKESSIVSMPCEALLACFEELHDKSLTSHGVSSEEGMTGVLEEAESAVAKGDGPCTWSASGLTVGSIGNGVTGTKLNGEKPDATK